MFERPRSGERAILVHIGIGRSIGEDEKAEFEELARSAGAVVLDVVTATRRSADPGLFVGSGKAEEIRQRASDAEADLVLFSHALTPSQERNLERHLQCRVLDRAGLILDIFAQRARSFEGKLQVELAQLRHLSTRLVRGWTHLERQKGGIGLRGPGETQLETDRRLIMRRIRMLQRRLAKFADQHEQGRRMRQRSEVPSVAIVGYTNAGKSTLFNQLTGAEVLEADQLFATLDPTVRRVKDGHSQPIVVCDTVGFVRDLPHELVAAFRSTLQEAREADLLLHVIDASDRHRSERIEQVNEVLSEIGAEGIPQIEVFNKLDLTDERVRSEFDEFGQVRRVWLSAATGDGMALMLDALEDVFNKDLVKGALELGSDGGRVRSELYRRGAVRRERVTDKGGWRLDFELTRRDFHQLLDRDPMFRHALDLPACADTAGYLQSQPPTLRVDA